MTLIDRLQQLTQGEWKWRQVPSFADMLAGGQRRTKGVNFKNKRL